MSSLHVISIGFCLLSCLTMCLSVSFVVIISPMCYYSCCDQLNANWSMHCMSLIIASATGAEFAAAAACKLVASSHSIWNIVKSDITISNKADVSSSDYHFAANCRTTSCFAKARRNPISYTARRTKRSDRRSHCKGKLLLDLFTIVDPEMLSQYLCSRQNG